MLYRKFGKIDEEVSILGCGCMRLPEKDGKINEDKATEMLRYAIDNGVNYIDTAYIYHNGESEGFVGKALKDGYREKVNLATKLPSWMIKSREDMERIFNEQLEKLQTDKIDFYLVHNLNKYDYPRIKELGLFDFLEKIKKEKKVRYIGFSFHDTLDVFKSIVDDYDWDFTQIQYNYIDEEYQAGTEGLLYAANKNLGVVIMEPLRGGALVNNLSNDINDIIKKADIQKNPAAWAFKFLYNKPEVSVVLSGMSNLEQIIDNINIANRDGVANSITKSEEETINKLKGEFKSKIKVNCTGCKYCIDCPKKVNIPASFEMLNNAFMFDDIEKYKESYKGLIKVNKNASLCIECGKCESHCPQHIDIIDKLKLVANTFEN
ncbi:MAG: aldo/keto reductase [Peptostreptococcaceae bacterium]